MGSIYNRFALGRLHNYTLAAGFLRLRTGLGSDLLPRRLPFPGRHLAHFYHNHSWQRENGTDNGPMLNSGELLTRLVLDRLNLNHTIWLVHDKSLTPVKRCKHARSRNKIHQNLQINQTHETHENVQSHARSGQHILSTPTKFADKQRDGAADVLNSDFHVCLPRRRMSIRDCRVIWGRQE